MGKFQCGIFLLLRCNILEEYRQLSGDSNIATVWFIFHTNFNSH